METSKAGICLVAVCLVASTSVVDLRSEPSEIVGSTIVMDEFGSGGWLALQLRLQPDHFVSVEAASRLGDWTTITEPLLSLGSDLNLHLPMGEEFPERFFRVLTSPAPVSFEAEDEDLILNVDGPMTVGDALGFLAGRIGADIFLPELEDRRAELQPGRYVGGHLDELVAKLGVRAWTPAFENDDPALARLFPEDGREQTDALPDEEPGSGVIEEGWC